MSSLYLATDSQGSVTSHALTRAGNSLALTLIAVVAAMVIAISLSRPIDIVFPLLGLVIAAVGVVVAIGAKSVLIGIIGILIAGGGTFVYAVTMSGQLSATQGTDSFVLSLVKIATAVAGVGGKSLLSCLVMCSLGYGLAEAAVLAAAVHTGLPLAFDLPMACAYVALVILLVVMWIARRGAVKESVALNGAARAEEALIERSRIIAKASGILHDTVLNDLQVLALSPVGRISAPNREMLRNAIDLLSVDGAESLAPATTTAEPPPRPPTARPQHGVEIAAVLNRARSSGLRVIVTGDLNDLSTLSPDREQALVMAIDQCLVNVVKHSGVLEAELAVVASDTEVQTMVTDAGRGFIEGEISRDRLGVRISVRERIEVLGGSVSIWSQPGAGTAILMALPRDRADGDARPDGSRTNSRGPARHHGRGDDATRE